MSLCPINHLKNLLPLMLLNLLRSHRALLRPLLMGKKHLPGRAQTIEKNLARSQSLHKRLRHTARSSIDSIQTRQRSLRGRRARLNRLFLSPRLESRRLMSLRSLKRFNALLSQSSFHLSNCSLKRIRSPNWICLSNHSRSSTRFQSYTLPGSSRRDHLSHRLSQNRTWLSHRSLAQPNNLLFQQRV